MLEMWGSIPWSGRSLEEKWRLTPVFLPGKSCGSRSLEGYNGVEKDSDMTERLNNDDNK